MSIIYIITISLVALAIFFNKYIHKYNIYLYILSIIVSIILYSSEANVVTFGYVGFSFMAVVMFTGVLENGKLRRKLVTVRAEYAIIGFILLLPHGIIYLVYVIEDVGFFNAPFHFYFGVLSLLVATPLAIISFPKIRKWISYKKWKTIQRFSYLFFALVALHLILLQNSRMWLYIALFMTYTLFRSYMFIQKKVVTSTKISS